MQSNLALVVSWVVAGASAAAAVAAWALRSRSAPRPRAPAAPSPLLGDSAREDALRLERIKQVLGALPGAAIVWPEDDAGGDGWGAPRLEGSRTARASLLRLVRVGEDAPEAAAIGALLDELADLPGEDATGREATLRRRLKELREEGRHFSMTIFGPGGRRLEADGRVGGLSAILWVTDATMRGLEEAVGRRAVETDRQIAASDPEAVLDMLARADLPAWRLNPKLRLVWCNDAYVRAVEAGSVEEAVRKDILLDAGLREQSRAAQQESRREDAMRAVVVGGQRRQLQLVAYPVAGGVAGFAIDITEAEETRLALERLARAQDEALNHLEDAVVIFGANQRLTFHNRAFGQLFKLDEAYLGTRPSHGELLDRLRERRLTPEEGDYRSWRAQELDLYERVAHETPQVIWPLNDGRRLRVARLRQPQGGALLVFSDITKELTVQSQFNQLLHVQRATLDKLREGVVVFSLDGRVRLVNSAFATIWELAPGQIEEGISFDALRELCLKLFVDREVWADFKGRVTDPSDEIRAHVVGEIECAGGKILAYAIQPLPDMSTLMAFIDVTAAHKLDEAMASENAALRAAEKIQADFVSHVSRQLRTPLQTIIGFAELLRRSTENQLARRQSEQLEAIIQAGADLTKNVEDIIDIASIEAKTVTLDIQPVELRQTLESAVSLVQTRAEHTRIRFVVDCPDDVGLINADPRRIRQAVYNLVLNAAQATPAGGEVEVGAAREGPTVRFWVEDNGAGMDPDLQARAFQRFTSAGKNRGAGLGLTLVYEFIKLHGGWVDIESSPGVGTRVTCYLPETPPDPEAAGLGRRRRPLGPAGDEER